MPETFINAQINIVSVRDKHEIYSHLIFLIKEEKNYREGTK